MSLSEEKTIMKCSKCGQILPEESCFCYRCGAKAEKYVHTTPSPYEITPPSNNSTPIYTPTYTQTNTQPKNERGWVKPVLIILAVIVGIVIIANIGKDSNLEPVAEPRSGTILSGIEYYGSEITVTASGGESYVVKLKTASGITRLSFYVRAGDTVTIGVPDEYLYVYFASGDTWYGNTHLFGKHTSYSMDDELCDFTEYTWEYTLYPVSNGNFSQTPIDADEF